MNNTLTEIIAKQELIEHFCKKYGITFLGIFGSCARDEAKDTSDIDMLVKFKKPKGLEFITIQEELANLLRKKVDLVTQGALHHLLKDKILSEVVTIYEKKQRKG
ncbi:MAG: nucleotidyltransferase family protein [Elusimicrobiota bacterium]